MAARVDRDSAVLAAGFGLNDQSDDVRARAVHRSPEKQALVVRSLGLRRIRHTIVVPDTPEVRGIIHKVRHLVTVG